MQDAIEELDNEKQQTLSYGSTSDYFRGDHTWQTLDKTSVGLGLVELLSNRDSSQSFSTDGLGNLSQAMAMG